MDVVPDLKEEPNIEIDEKLEPTEPGTASQVGGWLSAQTRLHQFHNGGNVGGAVHLIDGRLNRIPQSDQAFEVIAKHLNR